MAQHPSDAAVVSGGAMQASSAAVTNAGIARVFPVFTVAFAVVYFFGVYTNYGPIRYYPLLNEWSLTDLGDFFTVGPVMMWYGWVINGIVAGVVAAVIALLAPRGSLERLWLGPAIWVAVLLPVVFFLVILYNLREYFI